MNLDDPAKPEFASWESYNHFRRALYRDPQYASSEAGRAFIATVLATCGARDMNIEANRILYRAQIGYEEVEREDEETGYQIDIWAFGAGRMVPDPTRVRPGRANREGVAVLYLGSEVETVISEMRPWLGSQVSVSQFRIKRPLKVLNLTEGHGRFGILGLNVGEAFGDKAVDAASKLKAVWTDIDSAFSWPVTRDEGYDEYLPTQVLAEAFHGHGYDGIVYRSNFGEPGYNIALFNPDDAEIRNGTPYKINKVKVSYDETGNTWFKKDKPGSDQTE